MEEGSGELIREDFQEKPVDVSGDDIFSIQVINSQDNYIISKHDGEFILEGVDSKLYSEELIINFIDSVCNTVSEYKFRTDFSELKLYGLDTPVAVLKIKLFNSSEINLYLGNESPTEEGFYLGKDDNVYIVNDYFTGLVNKNRFQFYKSNLFPDLSETAIDKINMYSVYDRNRQKVAAVGKKEKSYKLLYPFETYIDWQTVYSALFNKILSVKDIELLSKDHDYGKYGLDNPDCFFEMDYDGRKYNYRVKLGREMSIISREGSDEIYSLPAIYMGFLTSDYFELIRKGLYKRNITTLSEIKIIYKNNTYTFKIEGEGDKLKIQYSSRILPTDQFLPLYRQISSLSPVEGTFPEGVNNDPLLKIIFTPEDSSAGKDIIELLPVSERECLIKINGKPTVKTYTKTVNEIIRSVKAVTE